MYYLPNVLSIIVMCIFRKKKKKKRKDTQVLINKYKSATINSNIV